MLESSASALISSSPRKLLYPSSNNHTTSLRDALKGTGLSQLPDLSALKLDLTQGFSRNRRQNLLGQAHTLQIGASGSGMVAANTLPYKVSNLTINTTNP